MAISQKIITALTKQGGALLAALREGFPFSITMASGKKFIGDLTGNADTATSSGGITGVTASVAELNLNDGAIAGTAVASKTLALGADKNVDTLVIADGGLALGAGAGTAVTATAAELNLLDTTVAGTAVASKALALGADKNVDTLAIADNGLKLGAGAGTAVTATANEINGNCDGTVVSVNKTVAGESPAGTNSVLLEFLDGNAVAYTNRVGFWCYWSDDANGAVLGTAFSGFTTAPSGGIELGGFTGNIFQYVTAADGTITVQVTGGSSATQYLAVILPNGRVSVSAAVTFA